MLERISESLATAVGSKGLHPHSITYMTWNDPTHRARTQYQLALARDAEPSRPEERGERGEGRGERARV
eukprot:1306143-Rhodomonas_salina.1